MPVARHFLKLYVLIVLTLAVVSWGQDKILQVYGNPESADDGASRLALISLATQLNQVPPDRRSEIIREVRSRSGVDVDLMSKEDIAGRIDLKEMAADRMISMQGQDGESWMLMRMDRDHVLALRSIGVSIRRSALEWWLTLLFYAVIALVLMAWIWPLARDLRAVEAAVAQFGNKNWKFTADIKEKSQIYPLAAAFGRMVTRIDTLIASHNDMSHAVSHEIKTPLSRMKFAIELARQSDADTDVKHYLDDINLDIAEIDSLVSATLEYAILERADVSLNVATHDFTVLIPAMVQQLWRIAPHGLRMTVNVACDATAVTCDLYLMESVIRNFLQNAARYARREIHVAFRCQNRINELSVEDDGPGVPEEHRSRVFESFVQLNEGGAKKSGFGLGLAIARRAVEWHGGHVLASSSALGGARFAAVWPDMPAPEARIVD